MRALSLLGLVAIVVDVVAVAAEADVDARSRVLRMFDKGFTAYMDKAYPGDELRPISGTPTYSFPELGVIGPQDTPTERRYGGVGLTLIDSLSTLALLGNETAFLASCHLVIELLGEKGFDLDIKVNVFEATIRALGGLVSASWIANRTGEELAAESLEDLSGKSSENGRISEYQGIAADLAGIALDLGKRLLPALAESPTGIPYPWINLRHGILHSGAQSTEGAKNSAAGDQAKKDRNLEEAVTTLASTGLLVEFGMLSRLTGNSTFEEYALNAILRAGEELKLPNTNLYATTYIVPPPNSSSVWPPPSSSVPPSPSPPPPLFPAETFASIGASGDSFFEILLKGYLMFGHQELYDQFVEAYQAIMAYLRTDKFYRVLQIFPDNPTQSGLSIPAADSLAAFWPAVQVLIGEKGLALHTLSGYGNILKHTKLLPERYLPTIKSTQPGMSNYPLRPELAESCYHVWRATKDPRARDIGRELLDNLEKYTETSFGYASVKCVDAMELEDYMPSYFLAETCLYLALLFSEDDDLGLLGTSANVIFSTEGHPFGIPQASSIAEEGSEASFASVFSASWLTRQQCPVNTP